ncbi:hypothetical protein N0V90_007068 [Kalmusia sp. IMI 367209]|nr:hypothetical protein N0V90_007068 [Kalmusia sp. IMI 367209]
MSTLLTTLLLLSSTSAKVLPRNALSAFSGTFTLGIPPQGSPFTTTVPACSASGGLAFPSFVVVGVPTGTFSAGTRVVRVPPQAAPTSTVYVDAASNETETIIIKPLPGECGEFEPPSPTSDPESEQPEPSSDVCPKDGCTGAVIKSAETLIETINKVTQLSQNLQAAAKRIGEVLTSPFPSGVPAPQQQQQQQGDVMAPQGAILDISVGLGRITSTLTIAAPRFVFLPPFPPSCSSDTIIIAFIEFVEVHQALLNILIGHSGLLERGPVRRGADEAYGALEERESAGFVGKPIAAALRALEGVVDTLALALVRLVPSNSECTKAKTEELAESIREAQTSYEG